MPARHRRTGVLLLAAMLSSALTALPAAPAAADVPAPATPSATTVDIGAAPQNYASAIETQAGTITGATFVERPGAAADAVVTGPLAGFPREGARSVLLTSGDARLANTANTSGSSGAGYGSTTSHGPSARDVTVLRLDLQVPSNVNCLVGFDFRFLSEEFPEYVGTSFNDGFVAEMDKTTWTASGSTLSAPDNFAYDPQHRIISINSTGSTSMSAAEAVGTTYDGATPLLSAATPITPGAHSLYLSIFDQGDSAYDSAVLVDQLVFGNVAHPATECVPGAKVAVQGLATDALLGAGNPATNISLACHADPVDCASGDFVRNEQDLTLPGRGPSVAYGRTYSSSAAGSVGPFGLGWASTLGMHIEVVGSQVRVHQENGSVVPFAASGDSYAPPSWAFATLTRDGSGWTYTRKSRTVFHFAPGGSLRSIADLPGDTHTLERDTDGRLTALTSDAGRRVALTTDFAGRVVSATDTAGGVHTWQYDDAGHLLTAVDPAGSKTTYSYDAEGRLTAVADAVGGVLRNEYDAQGRVVRQADPMGGATTFAYTGTPEASTTTITDPEGRSTVDEFSSGLLQRQTLGSGGNSRSTTYGIDPKTFATTSVTDALGRRASYSYDQGRLVKETSPDGGTTSATYDALGDVLTLTDAGGGQRSWTYDASGLLLSSTSPTAHGTAVTRLTRSSAHPVDVTSVIDPLGRTSSFTYTADGLVSSATNPLGDSSSATYDDLGHVVRQVSGAGRTESAQYDPVGRVVALVNSDGARTTYAYDAAGRVTATTDADGHVTRFSRDLLGRVVRQTQPDGSSLSWSYDSRGRVVTATDASGRVTRNAYDATGLLVSIEGPQGKTSLTYDGTGQRTGQRDALGRTTSWSYDDLGRVTRVGYADGTGPVTFSYDALGRRTAVTDETGTSAFGYDQSGLLTTARDGAGQTVAYDHDVAGQLTSLTYPSGQVVRRAYDDDGRLVKVTDWRNKSFSFTYDADGLPATQTDPNGTSTRLDRDGTGALGGSTLRRGNADLLTLTYGRTPSGLLAGEDSSGGASTSPQRLAHDTLGRLTAVGAAQGAGATSLTYNPDNLLAKVTGPGSRTADLAYDASSGWLSSLTSSTGSRADSTTSFTYDGLGERTAQGSGAATSHYAYSQAGVLTSWSGPAGGSAATVDMSASARASATPTVSASYRYDGTGLRTAKTVDGVTSRFAYDRSTAVPALLEEGSRAYVYGPLGVLEQVDGNTALYLHADQLGSTRAVTDEAGKLVQAYDYSPYGSVRVKGGQASPVTSLLFTGAYRDAESGLLYLHARTYDPGTGQFLTVDPLVALTHQAYGYANGAPLDVVDPLGLWGWDTIGTALGVVSTVTGAVAIGLALTGVGAPAAAVLEGISVGTGIAGAAVDCSESINVTCGIDIAAAGFGAAGAGLNVAGHVGLIGKETGELFDVTLGVQGVSLGLDGATKGVFEMFGGEGGEGGGEAGGEGGSSYGPGSGGAGSQPYSPYYDPTQPCHA